MQSISEAIESKDDGAEQSPAMARKATDVILVDLKYRESASEALRSAADIVASDNANKDAVDFNSSSRMESATGHPPAPPASTASQRTLRAVDEHTADRADSVDVVDLYNGSVYGSKAFGAQAPVTLTVRWRKVSRRVRFPPAMPLGAAVAMLVDRLGRDGKRRDPETLVLVRRRVDAAGGVVHEPLEPRDVPLGQFALSDGGGDQLLLAVRKCVECHKARIAACVTNHATGQRLFLCRQCATVAGVKQLKVQQMVLVGQIGELETKLKRAKSNAQLKKLADALRLAKARHRGIQDDILALASDMPKLTTVPVELKRSGSGRGGEPPALSPAASPRHSPRTAIAKDEAPLTPRRSAPASPVNTPPEQ